MLKKKEKYTTIQFFPISVLIVDWFITVCENTVNTRVYAFVLCKIPTAVLCFIKTMCLDCKSIYSDFKLVT